MSKVLVISTSLRMGSNSDLMADEFARGAQERGHEVEKISLRGKQIAFCRGCFACAKLGHCVIADDAVEIAQKVHDADVVCFATPIYYYEMSGQMKTLIDRCNSLYDSDYHFKSVYMLSCATEDEPFVPKRAESGLGGWIACFERAQLAGTLFIGGVTDCGDIKNNPRLNEAYLLGKSVE